MKEYKAVAAPMNINVSKGDTQSFAEWFSTGDSMNTDVSKGDTQSAFDGFAYIINSEAVDGWEYHSMETIGVTQPGGCMQPPVTTNHYMLIFVREK